MESGPARKRERTPPQYCRPEAYAAFEAALQDLDRPENLCRAATAIATHEMELADPDAVWQRLCEYTEQIRARVPSGDPRGLHAHAHELLFVEERFRGNTAEYYDPRNSYLPHVLETRRGLPITLSLLYKCVLDPLGLNVTGLNTPGHFLVRANVGEDAMIVDPFHEGRVLSREEAFQTIEKSLASSVPRSDNIMPPASARAWLARLLQNLQSIFRHTKRTTDANAIQELQQALIRSGGVV